MAQEIPGLRATLSPVQSLVRAGDPIDLRLVLQIDADTQVPGKLLTGADLEITVGDKPGPRIHEPGRGGTVQLAKGTRIERTLTFPSSRFVPAPDPSEVAYVAIAWRELAGTSCVVKVAPDTKNLDVATLDFEKTRIVLVTNYGEMTVSLLPKKAPKTVEAFVKRCAEGFYNGTKFHRVIRGFMIQGGDPNTKDDSKPETWGTGGPGYTLPAEFSDVKHLRGTLSMARGTEPNSAGSQFFIVHADSPHLDRQYTAFGNVEAGIDTLDSIANTPCAGPGTPPSLPIKPVVLLGTVVLPVKKK